MAETFQLRININRSLTDGAPKAPPSASCKPLYESNSQMTYKTLGYIFNVSIWVGIFIWTLILVRLFIGLLKKRYGLVKSSIKYLVNSLVFLFVPLVVISFAIVVNRPSGDRRIEWVKSSSFEWILWAIAFTIMLTVFNILYQKRIEKRGTTKEAIIISGLDLLIMSYGIFLGVQNGLAP